MDLIKKLQQYLSNLFLRYLLVTELYMVETWEKIVIHALMLVLFTLTWCFNYSIIINSVRDLRLFMGGDVGIQVEN